MSYLRGVILTAQFWRSHFEGRIFVKFKAELRWPLLLSSKDNNPKKMLFSALEWSTAGAENILTHDNRNELLPVWLSGRASASRSILKEKKKSVRTKKKVGVYHYYFIIKLRLFFLDDVLPIRSRLEVAAKTLDERIFLINI